ncbi:hypothetical protein [Niabella hibiscisoli]|uniref:hypothetical protein n=1 Tax=Niabella hibiscisoli TaxID=1825928 RepID=UPI001F105FA7|nr:hypothetical protein [Niabella hibiscisoli]MCH5720181.1 hypothetical protein [Niabella hibiscisoli]
MFKVCTITDIFEGAITIEDLLPKELYIQAVQNYLTFLTEENTLKIKNDLASANFSSIEDSKRYAAIAAIVVEHYENFDGEDLNKKVPISKL